MGKRQNKLLQNGVILEELILSLKKMIQNQVVYGCCFQYLRIQQVFIFGDKNRLVQRILI